MYCGRTTQYLLRMRVCEATTFSRTKSASSSESALQSSVRPGSSLFKLDLIVKLVADRNWNWSEVKSGQMGGLAKSKEPVDSRRSGNEELQRNGGSNVEGCRGDHEWYVRFP